MTRCDCKPCERSALVLHDGEPQYGQCWVHLDEKQATEARRKVLSAERALAIPLQAEAIDFSGQVLQNLVFGSGNLKSATFRDCLLSNVCFEGTTLTSADFRGAHLKDVRFVGARLDRASFARARLEKCSFCWNPDELNLNMDLVSFERASLERVEFAKVLLEEASFQAADLKEVRLLDSRAAACNFGNIRATDFRAFASTFDRAVLTEAVFRQHHRSVIFSACSVRSCDFRESVFQALRGEEVVAGVPIRFSRSSCFDDCGFQAAHLVQCIFDGSGEGASLANTSFHNSNLSSARFQRCNLANASFEFALLDGTYFDSCTLDVARFGNAAFPTGTVFYACQAAAADFRSASMSGVAFQAGVFAQCDFSQARVVDSEFTAAVNLRGSRFAGVRFGGTLFQGGDFTGCDFREADFCSIRDSRLGKDCLFDEADFSSADLSNVRAECCSLRRARFDDCLLFGTRFDESSLQECSFRHARTLKTPSRNGGETYTDYFDRDQENRFRRRNGTGASFRGAKLGQASFHRAELLGADFSKADLSGTDFSFSLLRDAILKDVETAVGADFDFAELGAADESSAQVSVAPSLTRSARDWSIAPAIVRGLNARHASFHNACLRGCDLTGADFKGATLCNSVLTGCDLTDVKFSRTDLDGADFSGATLANVCFAGAHIEGVAGFDSSEKMSGTANFSGAVIESTMAGRCEGEWKPQWLVFVKWLKSSDKEKRRANWVAWKHNYESLGYYQEQSECFRHEMTSRGWDWFHKFDRAQSLVFGFVVAALLLMTWCLAREWGAQLAALAGAVAVVTTIMVLVALFVTPLRLVLRDSLVRPMKLAFLDMLYGFGERPGRILLNFVILVTVFAFGYYLGDGGESFLLDTSCGNPVSRSLSSSLYFSVVTCTTLGYGDIRPEGLFRVFAGAESLTGLILAALFVLSMARRTAGR